MMASVLVTDGEQRAALAIVRSLGRAGHRVTVTSHSGASLAGASRYSSADLPVPAPLSEPAAFAEAVRRIASELRAAVILPVTEPSVLALTADTKSFAPAIIPFPPMESFQQISDKVEVSQRALEFGIRVPEQLVVESASSISLLPAWVASGAVLKPGRSVNHGQKLSVSYVAPGEDVSEKIRDLPRSAFPLLVQRRVQGPGAGIFILRWKGRTLAAFAHERIREKPPSGGVSVVRKSRELDPDLLCRSERLLDSFNWSGVAMLEYKRSESDGTPYLMEINGRFWGSLQLAIDSGVDFPRLLVEAGLGGSPAPILNYRSGVRSRWLLGDVDHLLARLRRSREDLDLPADAPGLLRVTGDFIRDFLPPNRLEVLRTGDLRPFLREVRLWIRHLAS